MYSNTVSMFNTVYCSPGGGTEVCAKDLHKHVGHELQLLASKVPSSITDCIKPQLLFNSFYKPST